MRDLSQAQWKHSSRAPFASTNNEILRAIQPIDPLKKSQPSTQAITYYWVIENEIADFNFEQTKKQNEIQLISKFLGKKNVKLKKKLNKICINCEYREQMQTNCVRDKSNYK